MRFADPEPRRVVGLAWRKSSPRKRHYAELGRIIAQAAAAQMKETEPA
jgi:LysR family transcriptional regulator, hydrogen peroxide-inducible genes activator